MNTPRSVPTELSLRAATPDDAPLLCALIRELAAYEREPDAARATPDELAAQMRAPRPPFECAIALWNGEPAGFALWFHNYSTWRARPGLYLEDLFVREAFRGRGIGRALLVHLARVALERGCARLEWAVLDWNTPAIGFYRGLGAEPMSAWTTFRLSDAALADLAK